MTGRHLESAGLYNARDLGGLPAGGGRWTRYGAVVRSEVPWGLPAEGWKALAEYGISTVVDLREPDEEPRPAPVSGRPVVVEVPLDDLPDTAFWDDWRGRGGLNCTPLYYADFLHRKADRCVAALRAVVHAGPGGVLLHCAGGRDRTGLVTVLLLALAGVPAEEIAADHDLSHERLVPLYEALGREDEGVVVARLLAERGTTAREVLLALLTEVDLRGVLMAAGWTAEDEEALRGRLLTAGTVG